MAAYNPFYVPPDSLEHFYSPAPATYGRRVVTFRPDRCSDDEVEQYRSAAAQLGYLNSDQRDDVDTAIYQLGGSFGSETLKLLTAAARSDDDMAPIVDAELEVRAARADKEAEAQVVSIALGEAATSG